MGQLPHRTTPLGKTGHVFPIGLACVAMSGIYGRAEDGESVATIRHAIDRGITLIDTVDFYVAHAVADGARDTGAHVDVKRVTELVPRGLARRAHCRLLRNALIARVEELASARTRTNNAAPSLRRTTMNSLFPQSYHIFDASNMEDVMEFAKSPQAQSQLVQQQLAVIRVVIDELERCLGRPDQPVHWELGDQLAEELESLARSLRLRRPLSGPKQDGR